MIHIHVRAHGSLNYYLKQDCRNKWVELGVRDNLRLEELALVWGIPCQEIAVITVNQKAAKQEEYSLQNNDRIEFYPHVYGG